MSTAVDPIANANHTYAYNALDHLTGDSTTSGGTTYSYDAADHLTGITAPVGRPPRSPTMSLTN